MTVRFDRTLEPKDKRKQRSNHFMYAHKMVYSKTLFATSRKWFHLGTKSPRLFTEGDSSFGVAFLTNVQTAYKPKTPKINDLRLFD